MNTLYECQNCGRETEQESCPDCGSRDIEKIGETTLVRGKYIFLDDESISEMIGSLEDELERLESLDEQGFNLRQDQVNDDWADLVRRDSEE